MKKRVTMISPFSLAVTIAALAMACGDDGSGDAAPCDPEAQSGCAPGLVCEETQDGDPACFGRVEIRGRVFDTLDDTGIEGAVVVALNVNGFARSDVALTDGDGDYELPLPVLRTADGSPTAGDVTLRVDAAGYRPFPMAPRTAIPIDLTVAADPDDQDDDSVWAVENAATDVALIPLREDSSGFATLTGRVDHADPGGALVVAEQGGSAVATAVTDTDGEFHLFNVPPGYTRVDGYRSGLNVTARTVEVHADDNDDVVLAATSEGLATVNGSVNLVDAPGGSTTSVILAVESTFDETTIRAQAPAGLRAGDVSGAFTIGGVPPGSYVVLAAYENDGLVRDPDVGISGTDIVHVTVADGDVTLDDHIKVTGALEVFSPGAEGLEVVTEAEPTFEWARDSGEEGYELRVFNAYGDIVLEETDLPRVTGGGNVTYSWTGATLEDGMIYQFRAVSFDETNEGREYMSGTEDLRGAFIYDSGAE